MKKKNSEFLDYPLISDGTVDESEPDGDDLFDDHILAEDRASDDRSDDAASVDEELIAVDESEEDNIGHASLIKEFLEEREAYDRDILKKFTHADTDSSPSVDLAALDAESLLRRKNCRRDSVRPAQKVTEKEFPGIFIQSQGSVLMQPDEAVRAEHTLSPVCVDEGSAEFDWTDSRCDLVEWIQDSRVKQSAILTIRSILWNYKHESVYIYRQKVRQLVRENRQSLNVHFLHLCMHKDAVIGRWLADAPAEMLPLLHQAASELMMSMFPRYSEKFPLIYVRIIGLSIKDSIRNLRSIQLRSLINIDGVIVRRSSVFKQLLSLMFDCTLCGFIIGPLIQSGPKEVKPMACPRCQFKGPFKLNVLQSKYRSHQIMILQESPSSVPPGRLPRTIELHLTGDLVDCAKPGDDVDVIGVFSNSYDPVLHDKQGFPVFMTTIEVNNIVLRRIESSKELQDEDNEKIRKLSQHPRIKEKLLRSVAPSMHGHRDIKMGLLLSLLGGVTKHHTGHRIRGDINVLLLGDPGMGKSQFLKWIERAAQRAVYTTGKGSSAVGLTAAVRKDAVSGEYVLEGGAMVIADRGVCLIDEFDKMNDTDRTSIHEAMEQQTISIARAGIVTTLSAQCTVLAAANPISGRYDKSVPLSENVQLTKPILSRFDLIHIITDDSTPESDLQLGRFVAASHRENHPTYIKAQREKAVSNQILGQVHEDDSISGNGIGDLEEKVSNNDMEDEDPDSSLPLRLSLFKKYVQYARSQCCPKILQLDGNRLPALFAELRQETAITVRELESIIRLAEAHARIDFQEFVREEDFNEAIGIFLRCYLKRHRLGEQNQLFAKFRKYLRRDDTRWVPLIENRLEYVIQNELALQKSDIHGRIVIPLKIFINSIDKDGIPSAVFHRVLRKEKLLGGKVSIVDDQIVYSVED